MAPRRHFTWLWWAAGALAAGAAAFGFGATGGFGHPSAPAETLQVIGAVQTGAVALDCPDGRRVSSLVSGSQVLVVARSEDGEWIGIRSAARDYETVWIAASAITIQQGDLVSALPVDACISPLIERVGP